MDISLNSQQKCLKFCLCVVHYHNEGTVSQIFNFVPSFCFMSLKFEKMTKSYPFFDIK